MSIKDATTAKKLLSDLMNNRIVVACITCNEVFLNMKWKDYLPLLNGEYFKPTKWYNKVALHYCQYPEHKILSNRDPTGINQQYNFTEQFSTQLANAGITTYDLIHVVREMEIKLEEAPI